MYDKSNALWVAKIWYDESTAIMNSYASLSQAQADKKLIESGLNNIPEKKPPSLLIVFLSQFTSPLVYILLIASFITFFLGEHVDGMIMLGVVGINSVFGFIQEARAQKTLESLRRMLSPQAHVIRDGKEIVIDTSRVVPGDICVIRSGDKVPADGSILEATHLFVSEAMLTGESEPVEKIPSDISQKDVSMGTIVSSGWGIMRVDHTGSETRIGKIAHTLHKTKDEPTPLQKELTRLARMLSAVVVFCSIGLFAVGIVFGQDAISMFKTSVAIAVSAIPEGMVLSLTVILALGMKRIAGKKGIVKQLISAETLGSVTVICVDKTGTLTEGMMRVAETKFTDKEKAIHALILANDLASPMERALWDYARGEKDVDPQKISDEYPRTDEVPFDSTKKYMAVRTNNHIWVKGAPDVLIPLTTMNDKEKKEWKERLESYGKKGLRVIMVGGKELRGDGPSWDGTISDITFFGLCAVSDPVREGVKDAVAICHKAGIEVKIITGDYRLTSEAVAREIGIEIKDPEVECIDGRELEEIPEEELSDRIHMVKLFSRVTPHQKLKIVSALKKRGETVAMTGDGVNDALALKKSDIAIVVGDASDVAKETSDLILLDSQFSTIIKAIEEGRGCFQNIRKVVLYLLSDAFSELILIASSIIFRIPLPITATQILFINILSDGFPDLALTMDPKSRDTMRVPPRSHDVPIIDLELRVLILLISILSGVGTLVLFLFILGKSGDLVYAQTMAFTLLGVDSLLYVFSCRSLRKPILFDNLFQNKWLIGAVALGFVFQISVLYMPFTQQLFGVVPLSIIDWSIIIGSGAWIIAGIEGVKLIFLKNNLVT